MNEMGSTAAANISDDGRFLLDMFSKVAFIRAFEAKVLALTQTVPPVIAGSAHLCAGQEVVPLAAAAALRHDDYLIATYRGHGWALASGLDPFAVMAEICQRESGVNGGRAGSAYLMAPHTRFIGENSIVGAGTTIACGVAMGAVAAGNGRIVVVTIGDGAMNQGAVHEAFVFAAARKLPVIFVCESNGWSELTATKEMIRIDRLAQRAAGYGMPGATISGTDPIKVKDSFTMAAERARSGQGPSVLEFRVPRLWGHYNRDIQHYRPKADQADAIAKDPLVLLQQQLTQQGILTDADAGMLIESQNAEVERLATNAMAAPAADPASAREHVVYHAAALPDALRVDRSKEMTYIDAVNAAMRDELASDPNVIVYGEDVGKAGGIFGAARYLQRDFGEDRVFDTPISENAILGSAVGAALVGLKPIVEIMWADFIFVALDQLVNQAANVRYITRGQTSVPLVVRTQQGATPGSCAQHSQSIEAMLSHVPGLKVALAASSHDAYALLRAAAADPDPCIVIEARSLYQTKGLVEFSDTVEPVGRARLRRAGTDAAIVTWGTMVAPAIAAAEGLAKAGRDVAVLDLRWLSPLDERALQAAVDAASGRILIVHEAVRTGGFGAEIAMRIQELCGDRHSLKIKRLTTPDVRMPSAPNLQAQLIPNAGSIEAALRDLMEIPSN